MQTITSRAGLFAVLFAVLLATEARAQPAPRQQATPAQQGAQKQERREKVKQRIKALRAYTLTEQLDLDEATAAKLFPVLAKFDDEFEKLLYARVELHQRLRNADQVTDPKAVDKLVDDTIANQRALWDTETKRMQELRKILTPAQTARVLVVLPAMERKINAQLQQAVRKQGAQRKAAGAGGELVENPFGKSADETFDPFSDARKPRAGQKRTEKPAGSSDELRDPFGSAKPGKKRAEKEPCDPFSSMKPCPR